jgi:hypothetical protein
MAVDIHALIDLWLDGQRAELVSRVLIMPREDHATAMGALARVIRTTQVAAKLDATHEVTVSVPTFGLSADDLCSVLALNDAFINCDRVVIHQVLDLWGRQSPVKQLYLTSSVVLVMIAIAGSVVVRL